MVSKQVYTHTPIALRSPETVWVRLRGQTKIVIILHVPTYATAATSQDTMLDKYRRVTELAFESTKNLPIVGIEPARTKFCLNFPLYQLDYVA